MTTTWTQADVDAMEAFLRERKGIGTIIFPDGQSASFASMDDCLKLLATMRAAVSGAAGEVRTRYASISDGF